MLNSAAFRLALLVVFTFVGIAAIGYEPASASVVTGRACSVSASPKAPITTVAATIAPIATPIKPIVAAPIKRTPAPPVRKGKTLVLEVTGYTSTKSQTDGDPCIGSHLINICARKRRGEHLCASNVFPIGSRVHIDGLGTCTIADHMASDRTRNIDWYFGQDPKNDPKGPLWKKARAIGRRDRKVTVVTTP